MKNFTKLLVVALSVVLLVGAIVGINVSAANDGITYTAYNDTIVSANVSYAGKLHLCFAIDVTHGEYRETTYNRATKKSSDTYIDGKIDSIVCVIGGKTYNLTAQEDKVTISGNRPVYIVETPGIAPKDLLSEVKLTVNISGEHIYYEQADANAEKVETKREAFYYTDTVTYSLAEYFYERLYKNNIINATDATGKAQKELYLATLEYAQAAQEILAPTAKTLDDVIYVWGEQQLGLVDKGATVRSTLANQYSFEYYSLAGVIGSDVTKDVGVYKLQSSTKIERAKETIVAPEGAVTFGGYAEGNMVNPTTEGSVLLRYKGQAHPLYTYTVEKSSAANGNINSLVFDKYNTTRNGTANSMLWLVIQNNSGVDSATETLVYETRMRFASGNCSLRFYAGRTAAHGENGTNIGEISNLPALTVSNDVATGEWFTLRVEILGTDAKLFVNDSETPFATKTLTSGKGACTAIQFTTASQQFLDMEFAYIYCGAAIGEDNKATITPPVGTLDYDAEVYSDGAMTNYVITSGATFTNKNSTYTNKFAGVKTENDNKYLSFTDTDSDGMAQLWFANTNDLTDKDTLTFNVNLRLQDNPYGNNNYGGSDQAVQIRVRNAHSGSKANTGYLCIYAVNGKIAIKDYHGKTATVTDIDVGEWFAVTVSYTSNAAACTATVTAGEKTETVELTATNADHQVEISAISNFGMYTSTGYRGIFDIDNISIVASKTAE